MNLDMICGFLPEFRPLFLRRYEVMEFIKRNPGVGRRTISERMRLSERTVREEIETLKDLGLVTVSGAGTMLTREGKLMCNNLQQLYSGLNKLNELSVRLEELLGVREVLVVKGDSAKVDAAMTNLGAAGAKFLAEAICAGDVIGVTGGRTLHALAREMPSSTTMENVTFVPARGGLGSSAEHQANTIVAHLAMKCGAQYKLLSLPDDVGPEALDYLLKNEDVREAYRALHHLDILVFGIGRADRMSHVRHLNEKKRQEILARGAVGEAFGHYFTLDGKEVYGQNSVGLSLDDFSKIPRVIGIAGGAEKAEAIVAISRVHPDMTLIIDEPAAREINAML